MQHSHILHLREVYLGGVTHIEGPVRAATLRETPTEANNTGTSEPHVLR